MVVSLFTNWMRQRERDAKEDPGRNNGVSASDAGYTKGVSGRTSLSKEGVPSDPRFPGGQDCYVLTIDTSGRILDGFVGQEMGIVSLPESIQKAPARLVFQGHTHAGALDPHHAGQTKVAVSLRDVFLAECRDEVDHFVASLSKECSMAPKTYRAVWKARYGDGGVGVFDVVVTASGRETAKVMLLDRTAVADELAATEKKLAAARAEARSSAAALADLSHEMKTPLNAVIGFADALRAETFGPVGHPRYGEYADHIHSSGQHLLDLVKSILDLARIEADRLTLSPALADPVTVARECAAMVRQSAEANGLSLIVEAADDIGECALDKRAVRQILINLLSNAVKFTSDGEVRLSVDAGPAEITTLDPTNALSDQQCLVFTVKDTGIGMDRETLERLGPRFTDAQGLGVRGSDGAGIGLSLAFKLAELHGGALNLSSAPGEGVTAKLTLPMAKTLAARPLDGPLAKAARDRAAADADKELTALERVEARRRARSAAIDHNKNGHDKASKAVNRSAAA